MKNRSCYHNSRETGYVMVSVLILCAVALLLTAGMIQSSQSTQSTRFVLNRNSENFYDVERSINKVTAWLQSHSKDLVTGFSSTNFNTYFDLGTPTNGDNEGTNFIVPTMLKSKGTNHAVQLTNSTYFGSSSFPVTTNIDTNASFDAAANFAATDFGAGVNVRLLVVWALQTDGHYQPIFRVDATTGGNEPEHGVHGVNFIKSSLVTGSGGVGYYSESGDFQTGSPNNQCWSYQYTWNAATSTWARGAPRSNCLITGRDDIAIKAAIHGNVSTLKAHGINLDGGSISGTKCEGSSCDVTYSLPVNPQWSSKCGSVAAVDITASGTSASPTTISAGGTLASQCYRTISIPSNKAIKFVTADTPYYIKSLTPQNNSNSKIQFQTVGPGHKYTLYIDSFAAGSINGNQLVSTNLAPNQLEIYITQDGNLTLNGTAAMNGVFIGTRNHTINLLGNFSFFGALRSNAVSASGNAVLGYDEALGGSPSLTDINFTLFKASQRYR